MFTHSPHQICPTARCAAAGEQPVHWPPSPRRNSKAAASFTDWPQCGRLGVKYLVYPLMPSSQQPCEVRIRFIGEAAEAHQPSVTFQNDTVSVRGPKFTCITAFSLMSHP